MGSFSATENKFLNELVIDTITYKLSYEESLAYIRGRFKPISRSAYKNRKARLENDESNNVWLSYMTRIGYVKYHKEQIEVVKKIQDDSLRQLVRQLNLPERDEDLILDLKDDIRENAKLLAEFGMGTPIISAIKSKLDGKENDDKTIYSGP